MAEMTELEKKAKLLTRKQYEDLAHKVGFGEATDDEFVIKMIYDGMSENEARESIPWYHEEMIGEAAKARHGLY